MFALACGGWIAEETSLEGVDPAGKVVRFAYGTKGWLYTGGDIPHAYETDEAKGWDLGKKELPGAGHLGQDVAGIWGASP